MEAGNARKIYHVRIRALSHMLSTRALEKGEELRIEYSSFVNDSINNAYVTKLQKKWVAAAWVSVLVGNLVYCHTVMYWKADASPHHGEQTTEVLCLESY